MTEQSDDEAKPAEADAPAAPAHRGPPIVVAEEKLSERGEETAVMFAQTLGSLAESITFHEETTTSKKPATANSITKPH